MNRCTVRYNPNPIKSTADTYRTHFSIVCSRVVSVLADMALYEMSQAIIMIGSPVPNPKTTGSSQFHDTGSVIAMSIIVKKYTSLCGQKAIAKNIPSINDHSQLLRPSTFLSHRLMPWSCWW